MDGPMSMPASRPLPTLSARVRATSASVNRSTIGSSTMTREVAVQRWPVEKNAALTTTFTASAMSASASTMVGFFPPISSCTRARRFAASTAIRLPVASDPVNEIAFTSGLVTISLPTFEPGPVTRLIAPFVTPASSSASTSRTAQSGARSDGFSTTALPAISAGAVFQVGMAIGKFHGVIRPTTPSGRRRVWINTRSRSDGNVLAAQPRAFAADVAQDVDRAPDFAARFGQRLALLARHLARDLVGPRLEDVRGAVEDLAALRRRHRGPCRLRRLRGRNRLRGFVGVRLLEGRDGLAWCRPGSWSRRWRRCARRPTRRR